MNEWDSCHWIRDVLALREQCSRIKLTTTGPNRLRIQALATPFSSASSKRKLFMLPGLPSSTAVSEDQGMHRSRHRAEKWTACNTKLQQGIESSKEHLDSIYSLEP